MPTRTCRSPGWPRSCTWTTTEPDPVFQIGLTCAEPVADIEAAGVAFHRARVPLRGAMYDIDFVAEPRPDGLRLEATYVPELFDQATIRRLPGNWQVLLAGIAAGPSAGLLRLPV